MPELPEVETVRRTTEAALVGRHVMDVTVRRRSVIATEFDPPSGFSRSGRGASGGAKPQPARVPKEMLLVGDRIVGVVRRGKQFAIIGAAGRAVCIHLGMSGQVLIAEKGERLMHPTWGVAHDHVLWRFDDGRRAVFRDPRRFGGLWLAPSLPALEAGRWSQLGPDALEATAEGLRERAGASARPAKAALLDQRVIAGIGNIYADEALFRSAIHPARLARDLSRAEWHTLAIHTREVLREAIDAGGSTLRDYTDARGQPGGYRTAHRVYGRAGQPCVVCSAALEAATIAQRTTCWCPRCQPLTPRQGHRKG